MLAAEGKGSDMAAIYDMDGVVADTQKIHSRLESELLATFGIIISPDEITRRFSGRSLKEQFAELFEEAGRASPYCAEISDRKADAFMRCAAEFEPIEGTITRIRELCDKTPHAIASASRPTTIDLVLRTVGVRQCFHALASSREVARGKPAPDVFLLAAQRLGVKPRDCVVVEDGVAGMLGARAAGMRVVGLRVDGRTDVPADIVVRDLREVPDHWFL